MGRVRGGGASRTCLDAEARCHTNGEIRPVFEPGVSCWAAVDSASLNLQRWWRWLERGGFLPTHWLPVLVSASRRLWDEIMMR